MQAGSKPIHKYKSIMLPEMPFVIVISISRAISKAWNL
jgi:hypothetical protein